MRTLKSREEPKPVVRGEVRMTRLGRVKPNDWNPNRMSADMRASLKHGLEQDGWLVSQSLLIWGTDEHGKRMNIIIDGEHRWLIAKELGFVEGPMVFLDRLTRDEAKLLTVKMDQKRGSFDPDKLGELLRSVNLKLEIAPLELGFNRDALLNLLKTPDIVDPGSLVDPDVPALPKNPVTKPGDEWKLGDHRLVCGDSREPKLWSDVHADLVWTDPPYGVALNEGLSPEQAKVLHRRTDGKVVPNDAMSEDELAELLRVVFDVVYAATKPGGVWYVATPSGPLFMLFANEMKRLKLWRQTLVWEKDQFAFGRSDYHYRHELLLYGWRTGAAHHWAGGRDKNSVLPYTRPKQSKDHPTTKPVPLVAHCVVNSSRTDELIVDPFMGSGTTLIVAEQLNRRCYGVELDPAYCDVVIDRWQSLTGRKAKR